MHYTIEEISTSESEQKQNDSTMSNALGTLDPQHKHHGLKKSSLPVENKDF